MSRFHSLPIARVERETRDAVAITFDVPPELRDQFRYREGQHLTVRATIDGADVRRSYSICSAVQDGTLRIAVKRNPGGVFSSWANASLAAGDTLDVLPPLGHFHVTLDPAAHRHYLGVAAGSGITPLLSIIATTLATEPASRFTLVYGNRASSTVMFKEALAALKDRYLGRLNLVHVLSREAQDIDLLHGRIDQPRAEAILERFVPLGQIHTAFVCGPEGMMDAVTAALVARGFPAERIKVERFATSVQRHAHVPVRAPEAGHEACTVTATLDGSTRTFTMDKGSESLLEAALRQGIELPYSCKAGVCSTCRCRLTAGEVDMDANFALEDYEVARGFVLACQSYAVTDAVAVTFDETGTG